MDDSLSRTVSETLEALEELERLRGRSTRTHR